MNGEIKKIKEVGMCRIRDQLSARTKRITLTKMTISRGVTKAGLKKAGQWQFIDALKILDKTFIKNSKEAKPRNTRSQFLSKKDLNATLYPLPIFVQNKFFLTPKWTANEVC